jgi:curved DNA-binding protein CbpA
MKNYYQILGISQTAGELEIRKAYRRLVRQYHPDINPAREAHAKFLEVQEAYEVLMDAEKRHYYDTWGATKPVYETYQAPAEDPKEAQRREYRKWRAARDREQELERAILEYKYRKVLRWINLAVATITFLMILDFLLPPKVVVVRGMNYYKEESGRVYYTQDYIYAEMGSYHFMVPYQLFRQYDDWIWHSSFVYYLVFLVLVGCVMVI